MPAATLGLYEVPDPRRCGIVAMDADGIIREFVEKPELPASNLAFSGLMIGTRELLDVIPESTPADIGFHVLPKLAGRMLGYRIHDYLIDVGTMENYQSAKPRGLGFRSLTCRRVNVRPAALGCPSTSSTTLPFTL